MKYRNRIPEPGTTISGFAARRAYSWLFQLDQMWKLLAPGVGLGDFLTPTVLFGDSSFRNYCVVLWLFIRELLCFSVTRHSGITVLFGDSSFGNYCVVLWLFIWELLCCSVTLHSGITVFFCDSSFRQLRCCSVTLNLFLIFRIH
jgi:hypothetical protein